MSTSARSLCTEIRVIDDHGRPRPNRSRAGLSHGPLWLVPALSVLVVVLGWPAAKLVQDSISGELFYANYRTAFHDPQLGLDLINTAIWAVAVPALVTGLGYGLAILSRGMRALPVFTLILTPMALPLVVVGTAFRLLYSPSPRLGAATAALRALGALLRVDPPQLLGPRLVTIALISAFTWAWVGLAVVVFRTALDAIPPGLEDAVRVDGGESWRVLRDVQWPFLRRVAAILMVLIALAASRTFDLVLMMAPDSVQHEAEVLALYVLRQPDVGKPDVGEPGAPAAVGVIWLVVLTIGAMLAVGAARHDWPSPLSAARPTPAGGWWSAPQPTRRPGRTAAVWRVVRRTTLWTAVAVWTCPVAVLILISLHSPTTPAIRGLWAPISWTSYAALGGTALSKALAPTAALGITVTAMVIILATLAAYSLAWLNPYGAGAATAVLLVAAIVPIQAIAAPLHELLASFGLLGTTASLALVHIGRGLPVAILVLRNAFVGVPADRMRRARLGGERELAVLARVAIPAVRPALIAVAALEFMLVWNDLVVGFLFGGPGFTPVGMALFGQSRQFVTDAGVLAAACVVASVVPVLVVLLARRSIVDGLVSGVVRR